MTKVEYLTEEGGYWKPAKTRMSVRQIEEELERVGLNPELRPQTVDTMILKQSIHGLRLTDGRKWYWWAGWWYPEGWRD